MSHSRARLVVINIASEGYFGLLMNILILIGWLICTFEYIRMGSSVFGWVKFVYTRRSKCPLATVVICSSIFEYPSIQRNEDLYDIFLHSHWHSNNLGQRAARMNMTSPGILNEIWITFKKEKRRYNMVSSGILIDVRKPFDKRNENE